MKYEIQVGASALEAACFLPSSPLPHSPLRQAIIRRCFISCLLRVTCFCHDFFNPMTRMARFVNPAPLGTSTVMHVTKVYWDISKVNRGSSLVRLVSHTPSFPTSAQSCSVRCFLVLILFPMLDSFLVPGLLSHFSASGPVELLHCLATAYA